MKKMFMAVIALMMTISASAQFYIYYSDGTVSKVDSISMVAPKDIEGVDNSQRYAEKLVGKWKNWDGDFWGDKIYTFREDKTGAESGYGIEENMTFDWTIEKYNSNYYIHVINWNWNENNRVFHVDNIYYQVEFMSDDIIYMSGTGTEDGTFIRVK